MKIKHFSLLFLCFFFSCKMAELTIPQDLAASSIAYDVVGKQKLQWKNKVSFAEFMAKETKKSFPSTTTTTVLLSRKKAKHEFEFEFQNLAKKETYDVHASYFLNTLSLGEITDLFGLEFELISDSEDYFVGVIESKDAENNWNFLITDISRSTFENGHGYLTNGTTRIEINEATDVGKGMLPSTDEGTVIFGFTFEKEGKVIGAVRTYSDGKVWIDQTIKGEQRNILGAMMAALLLKHEF